MRHPLLLPAVGLAAGIAVSRLVWFQSRELALPLAALSLLALFALRRSVTWLAWLGCFLAALFMGILTDVLHRPGPPPELDARADEVVILGGCVVEPPVLYDDHSQFILELAPEARARVSLYFREGAAAPALRYGQMVEFEARARHPRNFANPGSFDNRGYLARQNIYWTASARAGAPLRILGEGCGSRFQAWLFALRQNVLERLDHLYAGDQYATGMMRAILIGDKSRLERVWTDQFRFTGTYHALIISGLHLTALAAVFLLASRLFPFGDAAILPFAGALAWLYTLVTGWQTPVVRAAAGLTLYFIARFLFRRQRLLNLLAATSLGFLLFDPQQLFEASFQLSFLSVLAIAALAVPIFVRTSAPLVSGLRDLSGRDRDIRLPPRVAQFRVELRLLTETISLATRLPERPILAAFTVPLRVLLHVYELVVVSAAVQAGLALPMALYFHRVSFSGLSANVLVVPLMSLVVPVGFLAVFTGWSIPAAAAGWLLALSRKVVDFHAGIEPSWRIPDPPLWLSVCLSASLILLCLVLGRGRWRRGAVLAVVAVLLATLLLHPFHPRTLHGVLELTAVDVGQGESLFVAFPDGKLMVVDGGGFPSFGQKKRSSFDTGEDVVSPYLWSRSIQRLDTLVMTHAHDDHLNGLAALVENFRPRELWVGAVPEALGWRNLREKARRFGTAIRPLRAGDSLQYGGTRIDVLAPSTSYQPSKEPRNSDSLAFRIRYGERTFLLTGEIDKRIEAEWLENGSAGKTDVLKVAHHGSRTSSSEKFLDQVRPAFALISAGFENHYGYPNAETSERLRNHGATILRTDLFGLVTLRTDGRRMWADTDSWSGPRHDRERVFEPE